MLLGGLWILVTGLIVRSQLASVRDEVHALRTQVKAGDIAKARATLADLRSHAHLARELTEGPAWATAAALPAGGQSLRSIRGIAAAVDDIAHDVLSPLVTVRADLDPGMLRRPDGSIDLDPIVRSAAPIAHADTSLSSALRAVHRLPGDTWISPVDSARADFLTQLGALSSTVRNLDLATQLAPTMLGHSGSQRYFVAFQNDAESRGTGGLPGAFGILQIDDGKPHFTAFENDATLNRVDTGLDLGAEYDDLYQGYDATTYYPNSNVSPHFPYAAQIWATMWERHSGEHVDGAVAVDPTTLSYLLAATGPVTAHGTSVGAANVIALTQSTVYQRFADNNDKRKQFLLDVAKAVSQQVVHAHGSASGLLDAATRAAGERRLLVWSATPGIEAKLEQTELSGSVPETKAPYAEFTVVNEAGNKLDYYLHRTATWQRTGCGDTRSVTATMELTNAAPASGLPDYVTHRGDSPEQPVRPGDNRDYVYYAATDGALLDTATIDGRSVPVSAGYERGHPVYSVDVELPRGATTTVAFHLTEPPATGVPVVVRQPLIHPMTVTVQDAHC